jgi:hypothetical protein
MSKVADSGMKAAFSGRSSTETEEFGNWNWKSIGTV